MQDQYKGTILPSKDTIGFVLTHSGIPSLRVYALPTKDPKGKYELWVFNHNWNSVSRLYPAAIFDYANSEPEARKKLKTALEKETSKLVNLLTQNFI